MNAIIEKINAVGGGFVEFALPMLIQASVLIALLLLADFALRKRVRAVFRYWIWMLVLVKLVLPTSLSGPFSVGYWFGDEIASVDISHLASEREAVPQFVESAAPALPYIDVTNVRPIPFERPAPPPSIEVETEAVIEAVSAPAVPLRWEGVVFLLWAAIAGALMLLLAQRAVFVRSLVAQSKDAGAAMCKVLDDCRKRMKVRARPALKISPNATSPAVCGLFRPVVLVPSNLSASLGSEDFQVVVLHELAHVKRKDLWVNLAQTLLQIVYFYNPLLWLANGIIRKAREQAVDEAVLVAMGEKAGRYPETLVSVAKLAFERPTLSLRLIGVVESKSALTARIKRILSRPVPKSAKLGILGLLTIIVVAAILLPMAEARPYTERAGDVIKLAEAEARRLKHAYVGTEHIILALAGQTDAVAAKVLAKLGISKEALDGELEKLVKTGTKAVTKSSLPQTPRAKKVMEHARNEARTLNHDYIGTEHILLGLMQEREGVAAQILTNLGVSLDVVRAEVFDFIKPGPSGNGGDDEPAAPITVAYEKAPGSEDLRIKVGPSTFKVDSVIRWDGDGVAHFEDGMGEILTKVAYTGPSYSKLTPWMDIANIYISPDWKSYDVIELRVFDHKTRKQLSPNSRLGVGYHIRKSLVQLRSIGGPLPDSVDVWLRLLHNPADDSVWKLNARAGASVQLKRETISFRTIKPGRWSYSTKATGSGKPAQINWTKREDEGGEVCTAVFDITNAKKQLLRGYEQYQICAIGIDGERHVPDFPHFVGAASGNLQIIEFDLPAEKVRRFEFRPFHGRDRFYFDNIKLPKMGGRTFEPPPIAVGQIEAGRTEFSSDVLEPIDLRVQILPGARASGVSNYRNRAVVNMKSEPYEHLDTRTTAIYDLRGINAGRCFFTFFDREGKVLKGGGSRSLRSGGAPGSQSVGCRIEEIPYEKIDRFALSLVENDPRLKEIAGHTEKTAAMEAGKAVPTLRVLDSQTREPVAGCYFTFSGWGREGKTNSSGIYNDPEDGFAERLGGRSRLNLWHPDYDSKLVRQRAADKDGAVTVLLDKGGDASLEVKVSLTARGKETDASCMLRLINAKNKEARRADNSPDHTYRFSGLAAGDYTIQAYFWDSYPARYKNVQLSAGEHKKVSIDSVTDELARIRVSGKVINKKTNEGIEGLKIHFVGAPGDDTITNKDGAFSGMADRARFHQCLIGSMRVVINNRIEEGWATKLAFHVDPDSLPAQPVRDDDGDGVFCDSVDCRACDLPANESVLSEKTPLARSKWSATLANGVTVELIGICGHRSEGKQWWRPDGSALTQTLYGHTGSWMSVTNGSKDYKCAVRLLNLPVTDRRTTFSFKDKWFSGKTHFFSGFRSVSVGTGRRTHLMPLIHMPIVQPERESTDFGFAMPAGPWTTAEERFTDPSKNAAAKTHEKIIVKEPFEQDGETIILVSFPRLDKAVRVVATDVNGRVHRLDGLEGGLSPEGGISQYTYRTKMPLSDIVSFAAQTQEFQWVDFKNVSLRPGRKTDVEIEVEPMLPEKTTPMQSDKTNASSAEYSEEPPAGLSVETKVEFPAWDKIDSQELLKEYELGPEVELVVQDAATGEKFMVDLESGKVLTPDKDLAAAYYPDKHDRWALRIHYHSPDESARFIKWIEKSGADIVSESGRGLQLIGGASSFYAQGQPAAVAWDDVTVEKIVNKSIAHRKAADGKKDVSAVTSGLYDLTPSQPVWHFVTTRDGTPGIVQILEITDKPKGVRFRYRLVQKKRARYSATLANGVTVELAGFFSGVKKDERIWWQADGTPLPGESFQAYAEEIKPMVWDDLPERKLLYGYVFTAFPANVVRLINDVSEGDQWHTGYVDSKEGARIGYAYSHSIEQAENSPEIGGVKIAAAIGDAERFESKVYSGNVKDAHILGNGTNMIVSGPREYREFDEKMVDVTVAAPDVHVSVSYELESGTVKTAKRDSVMGGPSIVSFYGTHKPMHQHSFRVFDRWDQIAKFIVDCRKFELVTFKNVALKQGVKTNVEVEVGKGESRDSGGDSKGTVNITFRERTDLRQALQVLGRSFKKNIILSDKVAGQAPVTDLFDVTFEEALQAILGTRKYIIDGKLVRVYTAEEFESIRPEDRANLEVAVTDDKSIADTRPTMNISFGEGTSLSDALTLLGKAYKKNIVVSNNVRGNVPVADLHDVTFEEALQAILGTHKYTIDGKLIRIYTQEEFETLGLKGSVNMGLAWGEEVGGLRAAVEFVPDKTSNVLGERADVRLYIKNVSDKDVEFASESTRQDYAKVTDNEGKEVKVDKRWHSGTVSTRKHIIKPGDVLVLDTTGIGFGVIDDPALITPRKEPYYVGSIVHCNVGEYSISYPVNRSLVTGERRVTITARPKVDPRKFELVLEKKSMLEALNALMRKYRARICFEHTGSDSGAARHLLSGTFFGPTVPELLDKLIEGSPYKWEKINRSYVVYPKRGSVLNFTVKTNISNSPLSDVVKMILDQNDAGEEIGIQPKYKGHMRPHLWISKSNAMYAISRATEGADNGHVVWSLKETNGRRVLYFHKLGQAKLPAAKTEDAAVSPGSKAN